LLNLLIVAGHSMLHPSYPYEILVFNRGACDSDLVLRAIWIAIVNVTKGLRGCLVQMLLQFYFFNVRLGWSLRCLDKAKSLGKVGSMHNESSAHTSVIFRL